MARVVTQEIDNVTMQQLHDVGLNPFAVQLLVESYAAPTRVIDGELKPLTFVWRGVEVTLEVHVPPPGEPMPDVNGDMR